MKKLTLLLLILLAFSSITAAQELDWVKNMSSSGHDAGEAVTTDAVGNAYVAGTFSGTIDFDLGPGVSNLTAVGAYDIFVEKLDPDGDLIWAKSVGSGSFDIARAIAVDALSNVYIAGHFSDTVDFDPGIDKYELISEGGEDIFILKLNASGDMIWARRIGASLTDTGLSIALDAAGNVCCAGHFTGTVDFDPETAVFNMTAEGMSDIFVLKLNSNGGFLWAKSMGGNGIDVGYAITLDAANNVYTAGLFKDTVDFDPGAGRAELISVGRSNDIFVQKLDANGNFVWAKAVGGAANDAAQSIVLDGVGNLYTTGWFGSLVDFDPGSAVNNLTAVGMNDIFIQKLNTNGDFVWAKSMGSTGIDAGNGLAIDRDRQLYITGYFSDTADLDPGLGTHLLSSNGIFDIFIQKLDSMGNLIWVQSMGGAERDAGTSIAAYASGKVYMTGFFRDTVDFDPDTAVVQLIGQGRRDIFVLKLQPSGNVAISNLKVSQIKLYPNPSNGLFAIELPAEARSAQLTIVDCLGKIVHKSHVSSGKNELDLSQFLAGIYFITAKLQSGEQFVGKIVLK